MKRHRVEGLLRVHYTEEVSEQRVRQYRDRPATVQVERDWKVTAEIDAVAGEEAIRSLGGRVDAANQTAEQLSLTQGVLAYRRCA